MSWCITIYITLLNCISQNMCFQYWPSSTQPENIGEFLVTLENETPSSGYIVRNLVVYNSKVFFMSCKEPCQNQRILFQTKEKQRVTQHQIIDWNSNGQAESSLTIIAILGEINKVQQTFGGSSILVHCRLAIYMLIWCYLFSLHYTVIQ